MKALTFVFGLVLAVPAFTGTNLSDAIDKNEVPAEIEQREEETFNSPDLMDLNETPASLEERQEEEEWRESYDQKQLDESEDETLE